MQLQYPNYLCYLEELLAPVRHGQKHIQSREEEQYQLQAQHPSRQLTTAARVRMQVLQERRTGSHLLGRRNFEQFCIATDLYSFGIDFSFLYNFHILGIYCTVLGGKMQV